VTAGQVVARARAVRLDELVEERWVVPALLSLLVVLSAVVRTQEIGAGFWIDEGISVGIAHHHWTSIPHLLAQDGSPPLYYLLLGLWIRVFGDGEAATHALSLLFSLAAVPLAYVVGRRVFDRLTGCCCALLAAFDPFLTYYGQETRMYSLVSVLSLLAVLAYVEGVIRRRRAWLPVLSVTLAAMVYTHNWALFFCVGLAAATAIAARDRLKELLLAGAGAFVLYLPWVPTVLSQARHTGAPWATAPTVHDLVLAPGAVLPDNGALTVFAFVGGAALVEALRRRRSVERDTVATLMLGVAIAVCIAWVLSFATPEWTGRYFAALLGPLLVVAGRGIVRARWLGVWGLVFVLFLWVGAPQKNNKENANRIAAAISTHPGELIISGQPEQVPVLRYYFGPGLRWANTLGAVPDPQVFDWRDAVTRLREKDPKATLDGVLATVKPGERFVLVQPVFNDYRGWKAPWTKLVWRRAGTWRNLLRKDPRVKLLRHVWTNPIAVHESWFKPVQAFVYERLR
jgi:hypothetical protein